MLIIIGYIWKITFTFCKHYNNCSQPLNGLISIPSIFAILIPNRYKASVNIAKFGVETTWYYYPLNRLTAFKQFNADEVSVTDFVASNILILPFQLNHDNKEFNI